MTPISQASSSISLSPATAVQVTPAAASSGAGGAPPARSPSPSRVGIAHRSHPLQQQPPLPETAKLTRLAAIFKMNSGDLDAWLPGVTWGKHPGTGTYAVRLADDDRGHMLHIDGIGPVTEFPAALIDDSRLPPVWREEQRCYVPAADVVSQPPLPRTEPAATSVVLLSSERASEGGEFRFDATAFGMDAAVLIKQEEVGDNAWPAWKEDSGKRPRHDARQETGAEAEARWNAYRASQKDELPDFAQLPSSSRRLLQAAVISVPSATEYAQRGWQARQDGQPMSGQAIMQTHSQARFARRISGASSYERILLGRAAKDALDSLPADGRTAAALYDKLITQRSAITYNIKSKLRAFDAFLAKERKSLADVLDNFAIFAKYAHAYKTALSQNSTGKGQAKAVLRLRDLCFPELPFQQRIDALMENSGSAFHTLSPTTKALYLTAAGTFDAWLACNEYAPDTVPDDMDGLTTFLLRKREAIKAHPSVKNTKKIWKWCARRLAEYAWCHPMPATGYDHWVRTLDLNTEEWKTICAWAGVSEDTLLALVRRSWQAQRVGAA